MLIFTLIKYIITFLTPKSVFALVGESGTGKSFQSKLVAQKYNIDLIIDDGLLIRDNRILAGHSAKREDSFIAAVKVALFDEKAHRDEVARRLHNEKYKRILVLGTSDKMVNRIAVRLQVKPPQKIVRIDDFASKEDIEKAIRTRRIEGKHVIPVPSAEIKKNYPNIFYNTVRIFKKKAPMTPAPLAPIPTLHEKSVVRPEYSKKNKIIITQQALSKMVINCVDEFNSNIKIKKIHVKDAELGYIIVLTIDVPHDYQLSGKISELQQYIIENIEHYTGILIEEVNIIIDKIAE